MEPDLILRLKKYKTKTFEKFYFNVKSFNKFLIKSLTHCESFDTKSGM